MITENKAANAVGGKTARRCEGCLRKRARWYCPADDAFLCQACDASVHSANQLAGRHERVPLGTSSSSNQPETSRTTFADGSVPAWHKVFTRKARSPRHAKRDAKLFNPLPVVPEISGEEATSFDENEEQFQLRVPVFEHSVATQAEMGSETELGFDDFCGLLPSDREFAEFAADVESLLGGSVDEDYGAIKEENALDVCFGGRMVKLEEDVGMEGVGRCSLDAMLDLSGEGLDWNFHYDLAATQAKEEEEVEEKAAASVEIKKTGNSIDREETIMRKKMCLRLNYDGVITAWASQGTSPWTTGNRPEYFDPDGCWSDSMGTSSGDVDHRYGDQMGGGMGGLIGDGDGGREARVSRYREKRRTRLFSKKIRYEVRKLNAEKRPRMKGRFVKRTLFAGPNPNFPYLNK